MTSNDSDTPPHAGTSSAVATISVALNLILWEIRRLQPDSAVRISTELNGYADFITTLHGKASADAVTTRATVEMITHRVLSQGIDE